MPGDTEILSAPGALAAHPEPSCLGSRVFSSGAWAEIARSLGLSARQLQIARGIFDNETEGAIASDLGISEHTVHNHLNRLFRKLAVTTRVQLVLRLTNELLLLIRSNKSHLPPLCPRYASGLCQHAK